MPDERCYEWECDRCHHFNETSYSDVYDLVAEGDITLAGEVEDYCACCDSVNWIIADEVIAEYEADQEGPPAPIDDEKGWL